jgi:hypothetical protein
MIGGTCNSCAFWSREKAANNPTVRRCSNPFMVNASADLRANTVPEYGAAVVDNSGWYANLLTGPLFGCVNWQDKNG